MNQLGEQVKDGPEGRESPWRERLRALKESKVRSFRLLHIEQSYVPKELLIGEVQALKGNRAAARQAFEAARKRIEAELARTPDDASLHSAHGLALAGLGERGASVVKLWNSST